jgi:hypothetical protein
MVKRKERKMAEQYVEQLAAARERIVAYLSKSVRESIT